MQNSEFTQQERIALNNLDFDDYRQPITSELQEWYAAGDKWNADLRAMRYIINGRSREKAEVRLARQKARYVRAFGVAVRRIAEDGLIEENKIKALDDIVRDEEKRRLDYIESWYQTTKITPSSDEHFRDVVMAFADPDGRTASYDFNEPILEPQTAIDLYAARLDEHEYAVLGYNVKDRQKPARSILKYGTVAIGSAWAISRGVRILRRK